MADKALQAPALSGTTQDTALQRGVARYTAAWADAERMGEQGLPILPHQQVAMQKARDGLDGVSREATADLRSAFAPETIPQAAAVMPSGAITA